MFRFLRSRAIVGAAVAVTLGASFAAANLAAAPQRSAAAQTEGPCDIYAAGGTPCVAAHSTTRALYGSYNGRLYQVIRQSDQATTDIGTLSAGGVANAAAQDSFCANTTCLISEIYDQSGHSNDLTVGSGYWAGPGPNGQDLLADATAAPTMLNGQRAYGVDLAKGVGYRKSNGNGTATGDAAEGMYAVLDGTNWNDSCCFDYGNAETSGTDTGDGHMEALYFGTGGGFGRGSGNGPWIMADLENGIFSGANRGSNDEASVSHRYLTAMLNGGPNHWALKGGDATNGALTTYYEGVRPSGYDPMHKEGAIILGTGGDNSSDGVGVFYEGVMTSGYPSAATDDAVQANITAAGYGKLGSTNPFTAGKRVSLQATTSGYTDRYLSHDASDSAISIAGVSSSSSSADKGRATWIVQEGLADSSCVSFESADSPGQYLRHYAFHLYLNGNDGSWQFANDATFCPRYGNSGADYSFESKNFPGKFIRHYGGVGYIADNTGTNSWDNPGSWDPDTTWALATAWS